MVHCSGPGLPLVKCFNAPATEPLNRIALYLAKPAKEGEKLRTKTTQSLVTAKAQVSLFTTRFTHCCWSWQTWPLERKGTEHKQHAHKYIKYISIVCMLVFGSAQINTYSYNAKCPFSHPRQMSTSVHQKPVNSVDVKSARTNSSSKLPPGLAHPYRYCLLMM
jgi:hypothetical protein